MGLGDFQAQSGGQFVVSDPERTPAVYNIAGVPRNAGGFSGHRVSLSGETGVSRQIAGALSSKLIEMGFQPRFDLERGLEEMLARWRGFQPVLSGSVAGWGGLDDGV